jgi:isopentenyl diphosphate isomerase/L-lactate dehydrogenase-like FMN-dependent dehydrogenase
MTMAKQQNVSEQIEAINLLELEMKARELLPQTAYDYYVSGANDEITLRENRVAYERITLLPRMLVDVSQRHMGTTALGEPVSMPILIAPTAFQGLAHRDDRRHPCHVARAPVRRLTSGRRATDAAMRSQHRARPKQRIQP